jgi:hypothetical protein
MKNKEFAHVGDVQSIEIDSLPENVKKCEPKPVAYGEKSGHLHVITGDYEMFEDNDFKYIKVGKCGAFNQHVHESVFKKSGFDSLELLQKADHNSAVYKPNTIHKIGIHKAYQPYKKIFEKVID